MAASNGSYDIETGVMTIHVQPMQTLTAQDEREQLSGRLLPEQPANAAITVDVIVVDELGGAGDSLEGSQNMSLAIAIGLLTAAVLALVVSMLITRGRPRSTSG